MARHLGILTRWAAASQQNNDGSMKQARGIIIAAPSSGAGKTTITLGILRALLRRGITVRGAKSGPDYIDPRFHSIASGTPCVNLDAWAMAPDMLRGLATQDHSDTLIIEGAMGLFDGAPPNGQGSTADVARALNLNVVLVVDAAKTAHSIAPLIQGFAQFAQDVSIGAVILNNVGSPRHEKMLRSAIHHIGIPVIGALHRQPDLSQPSRHLGLVQADEHDDIETYLNRAADLVEDSIDVNALLDLTRPIQSTQATNAAPFPIRAQKIAIARDRAFAFCYPHHINAWRKSGAEIWFFSPLNDDPVPDVDLVFLPGGYPELFARELSNARTFIASLHAHAAKGGIVYGECGGYMMLGDALIDADGVQHTMAGLLRLQTSFATRKLHLGYRMLRASQGPMTGQYRAHEFHYSTTQHADGTPLFSMTDAEGTPLPDAGLIEGTVMGSFAHVIATD